MKLEKRNVVFGLLSSAAIVLLLSCEKNTVTSTDSSGSMTEAATSAVAGAVNSTTSNGAVGLEALSRPSPTPNLCPTVGWHTSPGCEATSTNTLTMNLPAGCQYVGTPQTWGGQTILAMQSGYSAACGQTFPTLGNTMGDTSTILRTYGGNIASTTPTTETGGPPGGALFTVILDTSDAGNAASGATFANANSKSPTTGIAGWGYNIPNGAGGYLRTFQPTTPNTHLLSIGIRLVEFAGSGTSNAGPAIFDHTLSTYDSAQNNHPLNVVVGASGSNVTNTVSGTLYLQHNLAMMTATSTLTGVLHTLGAGSPCCFPTGGTIVTKFTGGLNDGLQETMTFSPTTCASATLGQVQFIDINGLSGTKTLTHCL